MSFTRRIVLVALALFVGFSLYHAVTSYGWSAELKTPSGVPAKSVSYTCGAPWGSGYVHGPSTTAYPVDGTPCGQRGQYQIVTSVDVLLGVFALAALAGWRRVRPRLNVSKA